ncbi:UDP-N-acetylglucosamine--dolichyl-phosphate N-acetylglucosaminephosphotransferase [Candidatus Bipolaricaulota bacterium]|nr:UDP-N-acetylglucosamine--dolichyl-phosphate N-acetylglucosaminephosphotransferase [Candidatus Bipolaricaulota bacterium]
MMTLAIVGSSLCVSALGAWLLLPQLRAAGMVGRDMNKPNRPEVPEMGGLALVAGFGAGVLLAVALEAFVPSLLPVDFTALLAVLGTVLLTTLVGVVDDLLGMGQWVKAFLPLLASLPLVAIRAGQVTMTIPFLGQVDFGLLYPLVLVPIGVTGAANAANMLAGFNGLELGVGLVAMGSLAGIAAGLGQMTALALLLAGLGAGLGLLVFNWYPARVFVGDVGTLSIGAILATACIVGDMELAGVIVIVPYGVDFLLKAVHRFPSRGWWGELGDDGKLRCPAHGPVSLPQLVMKLAGGITERALVGVLVGIELVCGLGAVALYLWR